MKYYVCLEIGCNWYQFGEPSNNARYISEMVRNAATLGADAVKFQYYDVEAIKNYEKENPPSKYTLEIYELIEQTQLSLAHMIQLKSLCKSLNLDFICTPFIEPEKARELIPIVDRLKIRHRDRNNQELIDTALESGKLVYVSQTEYRTETVESFAENYRQVFCIPNYPATWEGFKALPGIDSLYMWDGYSNHIPDIAGPLLAASTKVNYEPIFADREFYIEVHYKLNGTTPVDDAVSLTMMECDQMIRILRSWEKASENVDYINSMGGFVVA